MNAPLAPALVAAAALDATAAAWPYLGRALAYARRVAEGAEVAGRYERLACERFLRDLARQGQPEFPYVLDPALGSRGCRFLELLQAEYPLVKSGFFQEHMTVELVNDGPVTFVLER